MTPYADFIRWLQSDSTAPFTYHRGCLAKDRAIPTGLTRSHAPISVLAACEVGDAAYKAYESGLVNLVQRRLGHMEYEYIAQKRAQIRTTG